MRRPPPSTPAGSRRWPHRSLCAKRPTSRCSSFSPLNPHLYFIPETTAGFAWAVFPHQAKALVALLWARRAGVGRAARFDRVLSYPNPPLCGPMLGGEYWKDTTSSPWRGRCTWACSANSCSGWRGIGESRARSWTDAAMIPQQRMSLSFSCALCTNSTTLGYRTVLQVDSPLADV